MRTTKRVDAAGDVLGERDGGVVAGGQQQPVEQRLQRARAGRSGSTPTFEPGMFDRFAW